LEEESGENRVQGGGDYDWSILYCMHVWKGHYEIILKIAREIKRGGQLGNME
jgi:hypothetical protein